MTLVLQKDVLIVDDDEATRAVICTALTAAGLTCDTAADGVEALEQLAGTCYAFVLLDLGMPRLDGRGLLEQLRTTPMPSAERPIVLVVTASGEREALHAVSDLVQIVIRKPFELSALTELVQDCAAARSDLRLGRGNILTMPSRQARTDH
ncbi:MAG TPA: response regulator [Thermoanaerobaculia bacterium]|nr:response regulator [Thermoanaerobaculia bacterium]